MRAKPVFCIAMSKVSGKELGSIACQKHSNQEI